MDILLLIIMKQMMRNINICVFVEDPNKPVFQQIDLYTIIDIYPIL